jgi:hypothetical protein
LHLVVGDTERFRDVLHERAERWALTYTVCFDRDLDRLAPVVRACG